MGEQTEEPQGRRHRGHGCAREVLDTQPDPQVGGVIGEARQQVGISFKGIVVHGGLGHDIGTTGSQIGGVGQRSPDMIPGSGHSSAVDRIEGGPIGHLMGRGDATDVEAESGSSFAGRCGSQSARADIDGGQPDVVQTLKRFWFRSLEGPGTAGQSMSHTHDATQCR